MVAADVATLWVRVFSEDEIMKPKELPVVFSAQEVRAVLDGRKTQFRRLVKGLRLNIGTSNSNYKVLDTNLVNGELYFLYERNGHKYRYLTTKCPFGEPRTRLWVRETWAIAKGIINESSKGQYLYKASHGYTQGGVEPDLATWCRSITMPRLASRITLEVSDIRVERLQDISEEDAIAEGFSSTAKLNEKGDDYSGFYATDGFINAWDQIQGKGSWDSNPWVWRVAFRGGRDG